MKINMKKQTRDEDDNDKEMECVEVSNLKKKGQF